MGQSLASGCLYYSFIYSRLRRPRDGDRRHAACESGFPEFQGVSVMFSNRLTFGALALACLAAAGAGGYFASRQNAVSAPAATVASSAPAPSDTRAAALNRRVEETEAVVAPERPGTGVGPLGTATSATTNPGVTA